MDPLFLHWPYQLAVCTGTQTWTKKNIKHLTQKYYMKSNVHKRYRTICCTGNKIHIINCTTVEYIGIFVFITVCIRLWPWLLTACFQNNNKSANVHERTRFGPDWNNTVKCNWIGQIYCYNYCLHLKDATRDIYDSIDVHLHVGQPANCLLFQLMVLQVQNFTMVFTFSTSFSLHSWQEQE